MDDTADHVDASSPLSRYVSGVGGERRERAVADPVPWGASSRLYRTDALIVQDRFTFPEQAQRFLEPCEAIREYVDLRRHRLPACCDRTP